LFSRLRGQTKQAVVSSLNEPIEDVKPNIVTGSSEGKSKAGAPKQPPQQVYSLCDSDEEDVSMVTRELSRISSSRRSSSTRATSSIVGAASAQVIDLTLDSDSDEPASTWASRGRSSQQLGDKRKRRAEDEGGPSPERRLPTPVLQNGPSHSRTQTGGGISGNAGYYPYDEDRHGNRHEPRGAFHRLPSISDTLQTASPNPRQQPHLGALTTHRSNTSTINGHGGERNDPYRR